MGDEEGGAGRGSRNAWCDRPSQLVGPRAQVHSPRTIGIGEASQERELAEGTDEAQSGGAHRGGREVADHYASETHTRPADEDDSRHQEHSCADPGDLRQVQRMDVPGGPLGLPPVECIGDSYESELAPRPGPVGCMGTGGRSSAARRRRAVAPTCRRTRRPRQ